jgi:putative ABC transport system permease protein
MTNVPAGEFWLEGEDFTIEGRPATRQVDVPRALTGFVDPECFQTLGIPLLTGRAFTEHDAKESPSVAVISRSLAEQYFSGEEPLGSAFGSVELSRRPPGFPSLVLLEMSDTS